MAFETTRDDALDELRDFGKIEAVTEAKLCTVLKQLVDAFNDAYPQSRRTESPRTWQRYWASERYLRSLVIGVGRLTEATDSRLANGSYKFTGDSILDLVVHLCQHGLDFAPPEPADEGVYKKVFDGLRNIYIDHRDPERYKKSETPKEPVFLPGVREKTLQY